MLAIIEDQMVSTATDSAERPFNDHIGRKTLRMSDQMNCVPSSSGDHVQRCSLDLKIDGRTTRPSDATNPVSEMHDRTIAQINHVMLKGDTVVMSPDEKMVSARQIVLRTYS